MDYLIDTYIKKPEYVNNLLDKKMSISLKVDGQAFQIGYDKNTDEVTYHKRGGSSKKLGPILTEYEQLFRKSVNDAIELFNTKKEELKKNKFYAIEMFNDSYILLTVIDNNDNIIEDQATLDKIAKSLNIDSVPILFNGILNKEQKEAIVALMSLDENTSNDEFKKYLTNMFGTGDYTKFLKGSEVEGIVLTWNNEGNIEQQKIINPAFKTRHQKEIDDNKKKAEEERDILNNIYETLYNKLKPVAKKLSDKWVENLDLNLNVVLSDKEAFDEILKAVNQLPNVKKDFWEVQMNKASDVLKEMIKTHGDIVKLIYEHYMKMFFKVKKRNYIINKEFQMKVNDLIAHMETANEQYHMSLRNYIFEKLNC